jgi:hypothetical protein
VWQVRGTRGTFSPNEKHVQIPRDRAPLRLKEDVPNEKVGVAGLGASLSTSKSLVCTAWVAEADDGTPTVGYQPTVVAETKQKAAS